MKRTLLFLNIVLIIVHVCNGSGECISQLPLRKLGENHYYIEVTKKNWFQATNFCAAHKMRLVSILNYREHEALEKYLLRYNPSSDDDRFWTSGNNLGKDGWYWSSLGIPFSYTKWIPNEPNNKEQQEDCVSLELRGPTAGWNDESCYTKMPFICQSLQLEGFFY